MSLIKKSDSSLAASLYSSNRQVFSRVCKEGRKGGREAGGTALSIVAGMYSKCHKVQRVLSYQMSYRCESRQRYVGGWA